MDDFKAILFAEIAEYLSNSDVKKALELIGGEFVLTEKKTFSEEEMKSFVENFLRKQSLSCLSFEIDEEDDRFFCQVEEIIPPLTKEKSFLHKTVKEFREGCERLGIISVRHNSFLTLVISDQGKHFTLEEMLTKIRENRENKEKNPWRGYGAKTEKELKEVLLQDFKVDEDLLSKYFK